MAYEENSRQEVAIKFGKGLVGEPFTSKNGKQLVEVKIPNVDPDDKTPWASFVISPKMIHDNQFGKGVWVKLPEDGITRIKKPVIKGQNEEGKNIWENEFKEISNVELKSMLEAYKTRSKSSVLGDIKENQEQIEKAVKTAVERKDLPFR